MDRAVTRLVLAVEWLWAQHPQLQPTVHPLPAQVRRSLAELTLQVRGIHLDEPGSAT
jgi:S-adenosylhomocysteine hydrolase